MKVGLAAIMILGAQAHKLHSHNRALSQLRARDIFETPGQYPDVEWSDDLSSSVPAFLDHSEPENHWIEVPKQPDDQVSDPHWGHEVQRHGHSDWLDAHVKEMHAIRAWIPPAPTKEDRVAVADS